MSEPGANGVSVKVADETTPPSATCGAGCSAPRAPLIWAWPRDRLRGIRSVYSRRDLRRGLRAGLPRHIPESVIERLHELQALAGRKLH